MIIQAEVSLYPLRAAKIGPTLDLFLDRLAANGVSVTPGPMSTRLSGDGGEVFAALFAAFAEAAERGDVVLVLKASNACPMESISS